MKRFNRTQAQKEFMYKRIELHGRKLIKAFKATEKNPVELCKKLRTLENKLSRLFTDHCNVGEKEGDDKKVERWTKAVHKLLPGIGKSLKINHDPRGYALKINEGKALDKSGIETDWGGYGIIAPDYSDSSRYVYTFGRITKIEIRGARWFQKSMGNTYHSVKVDVYYDNDTFPARSYVSEITYGYDRQYMETALGLLVESLTVPSGFNIYRSDVIDEKPVVDYDRQKDLKSFAA